MWYRATPKSLFRYQNETAPARAFRDAEKNPSNCASGRCPLLLSFCARLVLPVPLKLQLQPVEPRCPEMGQSHGRGLNNHDKTTSGAGGADHRYWDSPPPPDYSALHRTGAASNFWQD